MLDQISETEIIGLPSSSFYPIRVSCGHANRHYMREYGDGNKKGLSQFGAYHPTATTFSPESVYLITDSVIQAVFATDLSLLYPLLFSPSFDPSPLDLGPALVNVPDLDGWSAIHYCVSVPNPSVEILDALYRACDDVSLFTTGEHCTPLHCLARLARVCDDIPESPQLLYQLTIHLIRDLCTPLATPDKGKETCIHVAAEHGECLDVLLAFLDCDITGTVRNLRNSRGRVHFSCSFL
ncbi:hypothetical protein AZE42_11288 [Rhizopogon vesiculosus]|uniref:Uncharacterized protein n=1 Tax=Rhizopogon vesiculosus TaxID=180088 RepID=A0A1J8PH47_9AGAM|nr:hypothetical protein AZE42_11288 [Rhizopogon vesiculosus]